MKILKLDKNLELQKHLKLHSKMILALFRWLHQFFSMNPSSLRFFFRFSPNDKNIS